jgi:hypothetical protein
MVLTPITVLCAAGRAFYVRLVGALCKVVQLSLGWLRGAAVTRAGEDESGEWQERQPVDSRCIKTGGLPATL